MSRKGSAAVHFPQLYDYITRDAQLEDRIWHNFLHHQPDRSTTVRGFKDNARHIKQDRRHNILYHEVISLTRGPSSDLTRQIAALRELAQSYLVQRAPSQLAYGAIHLDKEHSVHLHLMISANGLESERRKRLSKGDFLKIQRDIESQLQRNYPELEERSIYNRDQSESEEKTSEKEEQMKRRTKAPSKKEQLRETLAQAFVKSSTQEEAQEILREQGVELVERGKTITAVQDKLRIRLKTIGLAQNYACLLYTSPSPRD